VKAMVEIVRRMGWSYVSIIYEESNYGIKVSGRRFDYCPEDSYCLLMLYGMWVPTFLRNILLLSFRLCRNVGNHPSDYVVS
jgi:hypothetical protein